MSTLRLNVLDDNERELQGLAAKLARHIEGEVRFGLHDRMLYSTDASIYQVKPLGVVLPRHLEDVRATVQFCADEGLPVLPRGGGTSLAGQTVGRAVVIDCSAHCNRILELDASNRRARVEPGVVLEHLNTAAAAHELMFAPDVATASHANIGGMIGNNSAGAYSVRYGRTVEHLDALRVMLSNGSELVLCEGAAQHDVRVDELTRCIAAIVTPLAAEIEARYPRILRHVDGYNLDLMLQQLRCSSVGTFDRVNLSHLACGSEGTLAVTLEATVRLVDRPRVRGLALVGYVDVDAALHAVASILETFPAAVELVDDVVMRAAAGNTECRKMLDELPRLEGRLPGAVLYVEYFADDAAGIGNSFWMLRSATSSPAIREIMEGGAIKRAWMLRKSGEPLLHGLPGERKPVTFVEDLAVDPVKLPEFVREFREIVRRHNTDAAYYAHASVGCLHIRPRINLRSDHDRQVMQSIVSESAALVRRYGGALSGEHGDGRLRSHLLQQYFGPKIVHAFAEVKQAFDPSGRLNPGVIVSPQQMTESLRVQPGQHVIQTPQLKTFFRFEPEGGFGHAVEQCNGAGVCRRMTGGTMCPSYRATRDERHATRGRGNALRLAVTGQFSRDGCSPSWSDAETLRTLDLCLSCKACKAECPSNVDVAKMKAEYLAQGFSEKGRASLRTRLLGHVRPLFAISSAFAPLVNALSPLWVSKSLAGLLLDIDQRRSLPRFETSLYRWFHGRSGQSSNRSPSVILFPDCFTTYQESRIGRSAVLSLEALGYRVVIPRVGCCGRSLISVGLLQDAIKTGGATARALEQTASNERAVAIVGCEPSCVSAMVDDWQDLRMDAPRSSIQRIAAMTSSIEDFIESRWDEHPAVVQPRVERGHGRPILLHGHCHQKALWGTAGTEALLRRIHGDIVQVLDSGCCGMAGSFGYTKGRFDLSMKIGEQSLFSRLRGMEHARVTAPGTSCRHQLHDGFKIEAAHPIELIAESLVSRRQA